MATLWVVQPRPTCLTGSFVVTYRTRDPTATLIISHVHVGVLCLVCFNLTLRRVYLLRRQEDCITDVPMVPMIRKICTSLAMRTLL